MFPRFPRSTVIHKISKCTESPEGHQLCFFFLSNVCDEISEIIIPYYLLCPKNMTYMKYVLIARQL